MIRNKKQFNLQNKKTSDDDSEDDEQLSCSPFSLKNSISSIFSDSNSSENSIHASDSEKIEEENYRNLFTPQKINRLMINKLKNVQGTSKDLRISDLSLDFVKVPNRLNDKTVNEKDLKINKTVSNLKNNTNNEFIYKKIYDKLSFQDMFHYIPERNEFVKGENALNLPSQANVYSVRITYKSNNESNVREFSIIEDFKKYVNPQQLGIKLKEMKILSNNEMIIKTCSTNDCNKIKNYLNKHSNLHATKESFPSLYIKGIDECITETNFLYAIINQNKEKFLEAISRIKFSIIYNMVYTNDEILIKVTHFEKLRRVATIYISPKLWSFFYQTKLNLGYQYFKAEPYIHISRCNKCLRLGHSTINCKGIEVCTRCFRTSHSKRFCWNPSLGDICYNCYIQNISNHCTYNVYHKYWVNNCPTYLNYLISFAKNWSISSDQRDVLLSNLQKKLKHLSR